jgi:beta-glucosidase-like glycosyl hydrolase
MPTSLLRRTASGLFMVGIPGPRLNAATRRILVERPPGGVILFRRNVRSAEQLRDLTGELHELGAGAAPLIALDHEGGRVHRLPPPFTHFPPAATVARAATHGSSNRSGCDGAKLPRSASTSTSPRPRRGRTRAIR